VYPPFAPLPSERKRDSNGCFVPDEEVEEEGENAADSSEEWLARNGAREMRFFSRRARKGSDPEFTKEWMKQVMAVQVAKVKAVGQIGAAGVGRGGSVDALVLAGQRVDAMSPAELVKLAGGLGAEVEE
jgi:3-oxoacyl-[acyl-carrier-protein] synthase III